MSQHRTSRRNHGAVSRRSSGYASELTPFTFARYSVANERHQDRNEDSLLIDEHTGLAAVFDGVGGSAAGEIASQTAARATYMGWKQTLKLVAKGHHSQGFFEDCGEPNLSELLEKITLEADELVRTEGARRAGTDDLATTVALAVLCQKPNQHYGGRDKSGPYTMVYAHVGDSRIYLLPEHGPLKRLTNDDGLLGRLVENQIVNDADAHRIDQAMRADQLSDIEFSYFRLRGGITQALGGPLPPIIHIGDSPVYPGSRVLLCTDGIHDNLTDDEIEAILRMGPRTTVARSLVEHALLRSRQERDVTVRAKPDDMTAVVLTCRF